MDEKKSSLTRRELYNLVWQKPIDALAKEFGISGRGLGKICERHGIPVPPRGWWAKKVAGKRTVRRPLIEIEGSKEGDAHIKIEPWPYGQKPDQSIEPAAPDAFTKLRDTLLAEAVPVRVPATLSNPHSAVARLIDDDKQDRERARRFEFGWSSYEPRYKSEIAKRRLRVLSALLKRAEELGFVVEQDRMRLNEIGLRRDQEEVRFDVYERIRQYRRPLTEEEKTDRIWGTGKWRQVKEPTGELVLKINSALPRSVQEVWQDNASDPLENKLHLVAVSLVVAAAYAKHCREIQRAEEIRRWEAQREAWRREEERKAEEAREQELRDQAGVWRQAAEIREYVAAVRSAVGTGALQASEADLAAWSEWALAHARELDPIASGYALPTPQASKD